MSVLTPQQLSIMVKQRAKELGFDLIGITYPQKPSTYPHFLRWLESGFHDTMSYMERNKEKRSDPSLLLSEVKSIIIGAVNYFVQDEGSSKPNTPVGLVARYASGLDYHETLKRKFNSLLDYLKAILPEEKVVGKVYVDTGPILERDFAVQAGLGWIGKNTCLINPKAGSYLFLGALITNVKVSPDTPFTANHCGKCMRCMLSCPTGAIVAPYQLDSRLCISYLTIELRRSIPRKLRPLIGTWVFGCDICQEVCPWNKKAKPTEDEDFKPRPWSAPDLLELLTITDEQFREKFHKSAIKRVKRSGLVRNACIAVGNLREKQAVPSLIRLLTEDPNPMVREHSAWALGKIATPDALDALKRALETETEEIVRCEIQMSLQEAL